MSCWYCCCDSRKDVSTRSSSAGAHAPESGGRSVMTAARAKAGRRRNWCPRCGVLHAIECSCHAALMLRSPSDGSAHSLASLLAWAGPASVCVAADLPPPNRVRSSPWAGCAGVAANCLSCSVCASTRVLAGACRGVAAGLGGRSAWEGAATQTLGSAGCHRVHTHQALGPSAPDVRQQRHFM